MRTASTWRSLVVFIVVPLVLAALVGSSAATPHDHRDREPGLYNPDCGILALATLGGAAVLPEKGPIVVVTTVVGEPPALGPLAPHQRPAGAASPRAPPRA